MQIKLSALVPLREIKKISLKDAKALRRPKGFMQLFLNICAKPVEDQLPEVAFSDLKE